MRVRSTKAVPSGTKSSEFKGSFATFILNSTSSLSSSESLWLVLALFHTGLLALETTHRREWGDGTVLRMKDADDETSGRERDGLR